MIHASNTNETNLSKPILPVWIMHTSVPETPETAGFASGSALALLHVVLTDPNIATPTKLLRQRLALKASVQCLKIEGRGDDEAQLRDAFYLTASGDARGPGGDMLAFWNRAGRLSVNGAGWREKLSELLPGYICEYVTEWFDAIDDIPLTVDPIARAAHTLGMVLKEFPREEAIALLLADIVLARALGWKQIIPLMAAYMKRKPLQEVDDHEQLSLACHHAIVRSGQDAIRLAHDLARRAECLVQVAPKLRSKGSSHVVELFLSEDAISPSSMLSPKIKGTNVSMTDRSARRICDRLVSLDVVRELTGRSTFRLYGV